VNCINHNTFREVRPPAAPCTQVDSNPLLLLLLKLVAPCGGDEPK